METTSFALNNFAPENFFGEAKFVTMNTPQKFQECRFRLHYESVLWRNAIKLFKSDMYVGPSPSQSWKQTWQVVLIPPCFTQNWTRLNIQRKESPVALQYWLKTTSLMRAKDSYRHEHLKRNNTLILINSQSRKLQEITGDWQQKESLPPQIINS